MEKTTFSSMTKAKKLLAFLLAVVLVLAMPGSVWAGPGDGGSSGPGGGGSSGPGGGSGSGSGSGYEYSIRPDSSSYLFNYQACIYDKDTRKGNVAIIYAMVTPALSDDKTIAFSHPGKDMQWSLAHIDTDGNSSLLTFRGQTAEGEVLDETSDVLTVNVVDKTYSGQGDPTIYGQAKINISYYNSLEKSTITLDANGGSFEISDDNGVTTSDSHDVEIIEGGSFERGFFDKIKPVFENDAKIFVGWQKDGDKTIYTNITTSNPMQKSIYELTFTQDTTLKAVWEVPIVVKFVTDKGSIKSATYQNGESAEINGNTATFKVANGVKPYFNVEMEADGFVLSGFTSSLDGSNVKVTAPNSMEYTEDVTFTAVWDEPLSFTFKSEEGYILGDANTKEKIVSIPKNGTLGFNGPPSGAPFTGNRPGYEFVSWVDQDTGFEWSASDLMNKDKSASLYTGEDKTFVAKWTVAWVFIEYVTEPTCTEAGVGRYRSAIDSTKIKEFEVEATGHKPVIEEGKAPTKTSVGWTTGSRCSVCGKVLKARTQIPMLKEDSSGKIGGQKDSGSTRTGSGSSASTGSGSGSSASAGSDSSKPKYSSEWVNGKWYNEDGTCTYTGELKWYSNSTGWWVEDTDGWYPTNQWQKIDGTWYFFNASGYMASSEWYNGYWLNSDGSWDSTYKMTWKNDATGWWIEDITGWWPSNSWQKIDGSWYYFESSGYMAESKYVDGYWVGDDGVCQ